MDTSARAVESLKMDQTCNPECDVDRDGLDPNSTPQVNDQDCSIHCNTTAGSSLSKIVSNFQVDTPDTTDLKNASCPDESSSSLIEASLSDVDDKLSSSSSSPSTSSCAEQNKSDLIPVPPSIPKLGVSLLAHKLWIGNLDKRLTEQNILKFVTQYGTVVSFKYLFKAGSERAEPRGYVFVEYSNREEAEKAKAGLDGKRALGRKIIADWAKFDQAVIRRNGSNVSETWDASQVSETLDGRVSATAKIAALEAKLKQMEEADMSKPSKKPKLSSVQNFNIKRKAGSSVVPRSTQVSSVYKRNRLRPVF